MKVLCLAPDQVPSLILTIDHWPNGLPALAPDLLVCLGKSSGPHFHVILGEHSLIHCTPQKQSKTRKTVCPDRQGQKGDDQQETKQLII